MYLSKGIYKGSVASGLLHGMPEAWPPISVNAFEMLVQQLLCGGLCAGVLALLLCFLRIGQLPCCSWDNLSQWLWGAAECRKRHLEACVAWFHRPPHSKPADRGYPQLDLTETRHSRL